MNNNFSYILVLTIIVLLSGCVTQQKKEPITPEQAKKNAWNLKQALEYFSPKMVILQKPVAADGRSPLWADEFIISRKKERVVFDFFKDRESSPYASLTTNSCKGRGIQEREGFYPYINCIFESPYGDYNGSIMVSFMHKKKVFKKENIFTDFKPVIAQKGDMLARIAILRASGYLLTGDYQVVVGFPSESQ